jgi:hypothetical protein
VPLVVSLFQPLPVTDDSPVAAKRAHSGQQRERDLAHPGSILFSGSGSAIKRITAGVKAGRGPSPPSFDLVTGLHPPGKVSSERKKNTAFFLLLAALTHNIGR